MSAPLRVPPATRMKFEQIANRICNLARLDFADSSLRAHEIVTHLEERWREGAEGDLNGDDAEKRALRLFGDPAKVASTLRRPWPHRLVCYHRYAAERLLVFLASYVCLSWLAIVEGPFRSELGGARVELFDVVFPASYWFFLTGLGSFGIGIAATAAVVFMRWRPLTENKWVQRGMSARYVLSILPLAASANLALTPPFIAYRAWVQYVEAPGYPLYLAIIAFSIVLGWLGSVCLVSEWLNFPSRLSKRRNRNAPFGMAVG